MGTRPAKHSAANPPATLVPLSRRARAPRRRPAAGRAGVGGVAPAPTPDQIPLYQLRQPAARRRRQQRRARGPSLSRASSRTRSTCRSCGGEDLPGLGRGLGRRPAGPRSRAGCLTFHQRTPPTWLNAPRARCPTSGARASSRDCAGSAAARSGPSCSPRTPRIPRPSTRSSAARYLSARSSSSGAATAPRRIRAASRVPSSMINAYALRWSGSAARAASRLTRQSAADFAGGAVDEIETDCRRSRPPWPRPPPAPGRPAECTRSKVARYVRHGRLHAEGDAVETGPRQAGQTRRRHRLGIGLGGDLGAGSSRNRSADVAPRDRTRSRRQHAWGCHPRRRCVTPVGHPDSTRRRGRARRSPRRRVRRGQRPGESPSSAAV